VNIGIRGPPDLALERSQPFTYTCPVLLYKYHHITEFIVFTRSSLFIRQHRHKCIDSMRGSIPALPCPRWSKERNTEPKELRVNFRDGL
jgi:hypothetical protein